MKRFWAFCMALALGAGVWDAAAQVRVTKSAGQKSSLDLSGFSAISTAAAGLFRETLEDDLARSGWFVIVSRGRGEFRLIGTVDDDGAKVAVKCQVFDTSTGKNYLGKGYNSPAADARRLAHKVADDIIGALTGKMGMNFGRIVMVGNKTGNKELYLCDADGHNVIQLTNDKSVSLAPKWSPDGNRIVYTSYLKRFPDVFLVDVTYGNRSRIASYPGLNTGAAFSPDGGSVALILSKDGNPELYVKHLGSGRLTRLTTTQRAAEASPSWSPDGSRIVFVSDQSGTPQLYMISRGGGKPARLTSRGNENVAPEWGPGGLITFSSRYGGRYQVCVMNPDTGEIRQITSDGADYEDPCWAPDGRHIACSRTVNYRASIYLLDMMGDPPIALVRQNGDWYSPAWSAK